MANGAMGLGLAPDQGGSRAQLRGQQPCPRTRSEGFRFPVSALAGNRRLTET